MLERAYQYVLGHGIADVSLRPLASAIGSSPRVLLFLFGSKEGLVRALLLRARTDELALLEGVRAHNEDADLLTVAGALWHWLADRRHRGLLTLWLESYARSLIEPAGAWTQFSTQTVDDWLRLLAAAQPSRQRNRASAVAERTLVLAILRGALLDLLATGDDQRTTAAVELALQSLRTKCVTRQTRAERPQPIAGR